MEHIVVYFHKEVRYRATINHVYVKMNNLAELIFTIHASGLNSESYWEQSGPNNRELHIEFSNKSRVTQTQINVTNSTQSIS